MTRIYITRHGQTEWNKQLRFQGNKNSELTEKGILGAELLCERMKDIDLDLIISSPLKRAYHTAEIVRGDKDIEIIHYDGLKEINLGDFEGFGYEDIYKFHDDTYRKILENPFENSYPNGENLSEFYNRVEKAFIDVINDHKGKNILIVVHGGTIRCIESYFRNEKINNDWFKDVVENCSLTCVEVDDDNNIEEIFYNDVEHLRGNLGLAH